MRQEHDSLGTINLDDNAYYGVQTQRAVENFPMTDQVMIPEMVESLVQIKKAAAKANALVGKLDEKRCEAIVRACDEILDGALRDQFVVDPIQGGAGTSANMNANEVIANRATELMGGKKGEYIVHPNDHVNMSQSTNDVFPSAGRLTTLRLLKGLVEGLNELAKALRAKAEEFKDVVKLGRTQLQDAVPVRLGQEFAAYAQVVERSARRIAASRDEMHSLNMGATAIGTSINAPEIYVRSVVPFLAQETGEELCQSEDLIDGTQQPEGFAAVSGAVKAGAMALSKICNDLRLLSSGPRGGLGEITLPARQHGSSIMPGKINPVIPEVVTQAAFRVAGNDVTIAMAVEAGQLELNAFEPVMFAALFESIILLTRACKVLKAYCVDGIVANRERCRSILRNSTAVATALCPKFGYEKSTSIVKHAIQSGRDVLTVAAEELNMPAAELEKIFDHCIDYC